MDLLPSTFWIVVQLSLGMQLALRDWSHKPSIGMHSKHKRKKEAVEMKMKKAMSM